MAYILEINQHGVLQLPAELLSHLKPYRHYRLEVQGETLILQPEKEQPFWVTATSEQRAATFRQGATQLRRPAAPPLTDEALSRDTLYD